LVDFYLIQTQTGWGRVLADFAAWIAPEPGCRALDVGCGPGLFPALLAERGCSSFGIDLDMEMFRPGALHARVAIADAASLPFPDGEFDLVTASNVLFFLPSPQSVLREMVRVLRSGGSLALLNPSERLSQALVITYAEQRGLDGVARQSLLAWAERAEAGRRWQEAELRDLFEQAGLRLAANVLRVGPGLARYSRGEYDSSPQGSSRTL
jgi:ubiquinone/menaquinone biosynthesis C-methylase UbiE